MATKTAGATDLKSLVGRAVEDLGLTDRHQYANTWIAFRLYSPPHKVTKDGGHMQTMVVGIVTRNPFTHRRVIDHVEAPPAK